MAVIPQEHPCLLGGWFWYVVEGLCSSNSQLFSFGIQKCSEILCSVMAGHMLCTNVGIFKISGK